MLALGLTGQLNKDGMDGSDEEAEAKAGLSWTTLDFGCIDSDSEVTCKC